MRHIGDRLERVARAAIAACSGEALVARALADRARGATRAWAVGKAAEAMARGAASALGEDFAGGVIVAKDEAENSKPRESPNGSGLPGGFQKYVAGHPAPDARGVVAARALLDEATQLGPRDRALLLISGGTSALLAATVAGVSLDDLRAATAKLLGGGAPIAAINTVRRHLGAALGGRLAQAAARAAALDVLALSDVVGDDAAAIGSGPASPDPTTLDDARAIALHYSLDEAILRALATTPETPKPNDPIFARVSFQLLATPLTLRDAALAAARAENFSPSARPSLVEGDVGAFAREVTAVAASLAPGEAWIAVGEPTVNFSSCAAPGRGGRAQQLALAIARALAGRGDFAFVACGSDGSDGPTPAAGAAVDGETWSDAIARGLDPARALDHFDAHPLLSTVERTITTGPTGTNLLDLFLLARAA